MKKIIKATVLALALGASFTASAAGYAVVDAGKILQQLPQREAIGKRLNEEFQTRAVELNKLQKELVSLNEKRQRDAALMTPQEQTKLVRKLEELDAQLKLKGRAFKEDQQRRGQEENNKLLVLLQNAIETVSKRDGYDLVVTKQAALFVAPKLDISDKIIQELSK